MLIHEILPSRQEELGETEGRIEYDTWIDSKGGVFR